ncbi:hypothetical protein CPB85DRAFT_1352255 [Mucidula mucida]|nr:hypothetical protein CPB85DRAFT_1352255 [Mucidula mucida]
MSVYDAEVLIRAVRPGGATPIGDKLNQILFPYLQAVESSMARKRDDPARPKPLNIVVITDGEASNTPQTLDKCHCPFSQVGIQFVQIGCDKGAERFLKELDDDLTKAWRSSKRASRDIVDTIVCTGKTDFSANLLAKSKEKASKRQLCY